MRGSGVRRRVCDNASIPVNWKSFLRSDENKTELFHYLAESVTAIQLPGVEVVTTSGVDVLSPSPVEAEGLTACSHEEANMNIFIHVKHALARGVKKVLIRKVDTDVVVLAIPYAKQLELQELWIAFGVGNHFRYLPIHKITTSLTQQQCETLPFFMLSQGVILFHTGFAEKERRQLSKYGSQILKSLKSSLSYQLLKIRSLKNNVVSWSNLWLSCTAVQACPRQTVNEARQALFAQGNKSIENIPPTQAALAQHIKRAAYQTSHVWGQALEYMQELPCSAQWEWQQSPEDWSPKWTILAEASKACSELISCGCKRAFRGLCKCTEANLPCTALCSCAGSCY